MHRDRNNGTWPELKAKRHDKFDHQKFDEASLHGLGAMYSYLDGESHDIEKFKKDKATKQLADVKNMFKNMIDCDDKQNNLI